MSEEEDGPTEGGREELERQEILCRFRILGRIYKDAPVPDRGADLRELRAKYEIFLRVAREEEEKRRVRAEMVRLFSFLYAHSREELLSILDRSLEKPFPEVDFIQKSVGLIRGVDRGRITKGDLATEVLFLLALGAICDLFPPGEGRAES